MDQKLKEKLQKLLASWNEEYESHWEHEAAGDYDEGANMGRRTCADELERLISDEEEHERNLQLGREKLHNMLGTMMKYAEFRKLLERSGFDVKDSPTVPDSSLIAYETMKDKPEFRERVIGALFKEKPNQLAELVIFFHWL